MSSLSHLLVPNHWRLRVPMPAAWYVVLMQGMGWGMCMRVKYPAIGCLQHRLSATLFVYVDTAALLYVDHTSPTVHDACRPITTPHAQSTQIIWLTKKFWITYWRDPAFNGMRFLMTILISLVLGTLYLGVGWTNLWDYIQLIEVCGCVVGVFLWGVLGGGG